LKGLCERERPYGRHEGFPTEGFGHSLDTAGCRESLGRVVPYPPPPRKIPKETPDGEKLSPARIRSQALEPQIFRVSLKIGEAEFGEAERLLGGGFLEKPTKCLQIRMVTGERVLGLFRASKESIKATKCGREFRA